MRIDSTAEPLQDVIGSARRVIIITGQGVAPEAVAGMLALGAALRLQQKQIGFVFPGDIPDGVSLLPGASEVSKTLPPRHLELQFSIGDAVVERVGYYTDEGQISLIVTPSKGSIEPSNLSFRQQPLDVDLIIVLSCQRLTDLGELYDQHAVDFTAVPLVNIDHHRGNERFGQLNLVDEKASGISEIVFMALGQLGLRPDYDTAECLLVGMGLVNSSGSHSQHPMSFGEMRLGSSNVLPDKSF